MIATSMQGNSEDSLMTELLKLSSAGGSVIQIRTREPIRAAVTLRKHLIGTDSPYREWDICNGFRVYTKENFTDFRVSSAGGKDDFVTALEVPIAELRNTNSQVNADPEQVHYFVYLNPQHFMNNPYVTELVTQYAAVLPTTNVCLIFITNDAPLQGVPLGDTLVTDFNTPNAAELSEALTRVVEESLKQEESFPDGSDLTQEDIARIAHMGLGLTHSEFEAYAAITLVDAGESGDRMITADRLLAGIGKGKTAVIRQSEILELTTTTDISEVGGMQRLKDWVQQRSNAYSKEAKDFGVEPPKGAALVGVPGTGKSLVAKAIASVFEVPLVRLDFGRVFSKYVGDSESRVRAALKMVESMAPCVLFVDEIDKGLGGAGGGGDSGTSSRVLGSFLTWLQECKAPVFTMVTANRVDGLPPELLRRGRFDQIFSVGMPGTDARREVFRIHLQKRGRKLEDFSAADIESLLAASNNYVPAEIESAIKDAITIAFNDQTTDVLEARHIIDALRNLVPMSKSHAEAIARIVDWSEVNATNVEYTDKSPDPKRVAEVAGRVKAGRRIVTPRRHV